MPVEFVKVNSSFLRASIPITYVQVLVFTTSNPYYPIYYDPAYRIISIDP